MRRLGLGLLLVLAVLCGATRVNGQPTAESALWQDVDRAETLQDMTALAAKVCVPSGTIEQSVEPPLSKAERDFVSTVQPLIRASLAGVYGSDIPFWMERVTHVQSMKKHPAVLRVVVEVQTYEGAHNPFGIDTIEFQKVPGPHLFISRVEHRKDPRARPRR